MDEYMRTKSRGLKGLPEPNEFSFQFAILDFTGSPVGEDHLKDFSLGFDLETGDVKYMSITAVSTGDSRSAREFKLPIRTHWEEVLANFTANAPEGLRICYQEADIFWAWMESEKAFFDGAIKGIGISGALAFLILIIATNNVFTALIAIKSVAFIVCSVMAIMVLQGW